MSWERALCNFEKVLREFQKGKMPGIWTMAEAKKAFQNQMGHGKKSLKRKLQNTVLDRLLISYFGQ